ncbi:hypothetical protein K443DRAFT_676691 [Laccaria amethystina LaAM-08-1]|uniref:Unplaced genomic scaffold K443scaffold_44, whole genome shotgun sequence n=1 Tax=Laccaria amethystina LaAM-08-1 TaxID=1095629 RepID=A0A0C9WVK6_9AGAR|nr:hypothetical protein K443DRAFT_676691 [Laccaria amethystina LaAM-08-1]
MSPGNGVANGIAANGVAATTDTTATTAVTTATSATTTTTPNTPPATTPPATPKPSFFSKLFHILVPCISSSPAIEIDLPNPSKSSLTQNEKPAITPPIISDPPPLIIPTIESPPPAESTTVETPVILPPTQILPDEETHGMTSGAVQPPGSIDGSTSVQKQNHPSEEEESEGTSFTEDDDQDLHVDEEDEEDKLILNGGAGIPIGPDGIPKPLLPPISPQHAGRKCLVLDLDETLVHSSFKSIQQADYVVPVEIEYNWHNVYVIKRPGVDNFLKKMGEIYEVVVFTASLSKYADPVLDKLDIHQVVSHRLFRESCYNHKGNYVKDLSQLGRPISDTIILDNSPASYIFHPNNAVPVSSWFNDPHDTELTDLVPFLADLSTVDDVRGVLDGAR